MIEVVVLPENRPYSESYTALLTGWVTYEGRVMAMVVEGDGYAYMIPQSRIRVKV